MVNLQTNLTVPIKTPLTDSSGNLSLPWVKFFQSLIAALMGADEAIKSAGLTLDLNGDVRGASALLTANTIPVVNSPGVLGQSSISDNGSQVSTAEPVSIGASAPAVSGATLGVHVATNENLDVTGPTNLSTGITIHSINDAASSNEGLEFRATPFCFKIGDVGFGGNASPGYPVDSTGDINTSTVYRVGGTQVVGAQQSAISSVSGTAGGTYTTATQTLINSLVTAINAALSAMAAHGLIA